MSLAETAIETAVEGAIPGGPVIAVVKKIVTSKWLWLAVVALGAGLGLFFYLQHDKSQAVQAAVTGANSSATTQTYQASDAATRIIADRSQPYIILHDQTVKDYANAHATLDHAPVAAREAAAPDLLVDTLNSLDRMRSARNPSAVPDAAVQP